MNNKILWGCDISHYNDPNMIPRNSAFVFIKSTEGKTFVDPALHTNLQWIADSMNKDLPIIGFYHFARPDNNDAKSEAEHYLSTIHDHIGKCIMALDIEGTQLHVRNVEDWCKTWLDYVRDNTGALPFIYTSAYALSKFDDIKGRYPLWVAHYNISKPRVDRIKWFDYPIMWQYTSKPIDCDMFYGDRADLIKFAGVK